MLLLFQDKLSYQQFNTTIYLSWLIHSEGVLGREVHTSEHDKLWEFQYQKIQGNQEQ